MPLFLGGLSLLAFCSGDARRNWPGVVLGRRPDRALIAVTAYVGCVRPSDADLERPQGRSGSGRWGRGLGFLSLPAPKPLLLLPTSSPFDRNRRGLKRAPMDLIAAISARKRRASRPDDRFFTSRFCKPAIPKQGLAFAPASAASCSVGALLDAVRSVGCAGLVKFIGH